MECKKILPNKQQCQAQAQQGKVKSILNMIYSVLQRVFSLFSMDLNDILFGAERDRVTRASESTYNLTQLQQLGLQITVNTSSQKARWVGNANNQLYP